MDVEGDIAMYCVLTCTELQLGSLHSSLQAATFEIWIPPTFAKHYKLKKNIGLLSQ